MGQKSNPIILRLKKTNQSWNSSWYADHYYNYTAFLLDDCATRTYMQNCSQQFKKFSPILYMRRGRGDMQIALFSPRSPFKKATTSSRSVIFSKLLTNKFTFLPQFSTNKVEIKQEQKKAKVKICRNMLFARSLSIVTKERMLKLLPLKGLVTTNRTTENALLNTPTNFSKQPSILYNSVELEKGNPFSQPHVTRRKQYKTPIKNQLEYSLSQYLQSTCKIHLVKCSFLYQNPHFLATHIVFLLQTRVSFRQLKHRLIGDMSKSPILKGVQITCSGRVAARSKKAQKARTESIQWGETARNVFSQLVHFASQSALTPYGKIGVKVWVCYNEASFCPLT